MPGIDQLVGEFEHLRTQVGLLNGYLSAIFHPNLVVASLIEKTLVPLDFVWGHFIITTSDVGGGDFVGNATIQQFEPKVQLVADAALALVAMWSAYRIMWGHGLFTQYTARILLPRLFMAGVLINFPLMLFQFGVDASNTLSSAAYRMITIDPPSYFLGGFIPAMPVDPLEVATIAVLAAAFDVFAVTYVLRFAILIVLAVTAPVAALFFMLPETNHISKLWMSHFTTNLFMQPMQLFVLAIGFALERQGVSPVRHLFAIASLLIVFKIPGAMGGSEKMAHKLQETVHKGLHLLVHAAAKA